MWIISFRLVTKSSFYLATFTTKNTIARGLQAAVVIKDFIIKALEAHYVVKLNRASNTGLLQRCIVFLRFMPLIIEMLLLILSGVGIRHSGECSVSTQCIIKYIGEEFWSNIPLRKSYSLQQFATTRLKKILMQYAPYITT